MSKQVSYFIVTLIVGGLFYSTHAANIVRLETTKGNIVLELDSAKAPITVANFLGYVRSSFYNGTIFHRVIKSFMIQGGGVTENLIEKPTNPPIRNEAYNKLSNVRGTIAMARETPPHTATSQFYINHVNNLFLNYKDSSSDTRWGYCVFGKVIEGLAIVDSIANAATDSINPDYVDVPKIPIFIIKALEVTTGISTTINIKPVTSVTFRTNGSRLAACVQSKQNAIFRLYTLKGSTVVTYTGIKPGLTMVPINALSSGVYIFKITTGNDLIAGGTVLQQ